MMVKVADFGLSRDIYVSDYYRLEHSTPLPIKWLAPEAIFDRVFTIKSDVVSVNINVWKNQNHSSLVYKYKLRMTGSPKVVLIISDAPI